MYIHEAIEEATKANRLIARKSIEEFAPGNPVEIGKGTHGLYWLFSFENDGETLKNARFWYPSADDLMADDWAVLIKRVPVFPEKPQKEKRRWRCIFTKR